MILHAEGNVKLYYLQTLCLIFFPGSTFSPDEEPGEGVPEVFVKVYPDNDNNACTAYVSIRLNDKICESSETVSYDVPLVMADHESLAVGRAFFAAGKELLGLTSPWGILTGIRPSKIAAKLLLAGNGVLKTRKILHEEYLLNPQKAALVTTVAGSEIKTLKSMPKNSCSLYISVPFCPTRCAYCSFVSYTTPKLLSLIDEYLNCLIKDLGNTFTTIRKLGFSIHTIYIGGGTPTILSAAQLKKLLSYIHRHLRDGEAVEFSLEGGRPDTITKEKVDMAVSYGVTRMSVNPQTLNDDILKEIGRKHTVADFYRAYDIVKASGIKDINIDLIAGLPGDDFKNFSDTMDKIIALHPTNITVHSFTVKKASDALKRNSAIYSTAGTDATKSVAYAQLKTKFAGYRPYYMYKQKNTIGNLENVGYAVDGAKCLYNVYMMEEKQTIFGVGAGAVTKLVSLTERPEDVRIKRIFQPKYPYEYLQENHDDLMKQTSLQILSFFDGTVS